MMTASTIGLAMAASPPQRNTVRSKSSKSLQATVYRNLCKARVEGTVCGGPGLAKDLGRAYDRRYLFIRRASQNGNRSLLGTNCECVRR